MCPATLCSFILRHLKPACHVKHQLLDFLYCWQCCEQVIFAQAPSLKLFGPSLELFFGGKSRHRLYQVESLVKARQVPNQVTFFYTQDKVLLPVVPGLYEEKRQGRGKESLKATGCHSKLFDWQLVIQS